VHYVPTDKINASVHIRVQRIMKVEIKTTQILKFNLGYYEIHEFFVKKRVT